MALETSDTTLTPRSIVFEVDAGWRGLDGGAVWHLARTAGLDGECMVIYVPKAVKFGVMAASMMSFL
jgi:hypothetical protein